ncbi:formamidopyrimidine-DNA glycosylase [Paenibacillus cisolokensis]|mgnify:CR=1 FL=1|uniref:Formamidopyrimidine-DNA glycosylase n=1 Tax=Paenibacillus cisolokensis TaxID=1658519 RepID=A0ABQ4N9P5_9BACL|nr:DNA-formamidopyrimidine glycosylase [Paenibacillus cisolokensis]GIQ64668.1 formamidopyrimidine-DNA glycosylase [Paenibacillus cisolokensis]
MPELPEVETVRRTLNQLVAGKRIESVTVSLPRIIQRPAEPEAFAAALAGRTIETVERSGKFLRIVLDGLVLVSHLRMEGRYGVYAQDEPVEKHTHVIFHFDDGTELRYKDVRQFGTMHLFAPGEELKQPPLSRLGLEPLSDSFTPDALRKMLAHRPTKIKPLLLNQTYVAGLGNIYVDEALFQAGIHPERSADSLKAAEWRRLYESIRATLERAVEAGGSSIKSYVNGQGEMGMFQHQLLVYGRKGEPCSRCGGPITKTVVGGRGTHICLRCQPPRRKRRAATAGELSN